MNFGQSIGTCLRKTFHYAGRASRSEFWWFMLFNLIVSLAASQLDSGLSLLVTVLLLLPCSSVSWRRLHDIGRSGWWLLIGFIPLIGGLLLLYWNVQPSQPEINFWGPPPEAT
jgi:uncharacterized membrane protein YhaH (DUF805 family)